MYMGQNWKGAEYMLAGDGYRVILESLNHYIAKLEGIIGPSYQADGMFKLIIQETAAKRIPQVRATLETVHSFLIKKSTAQSLIQEIPVMNSALDSYRFDLEQLQHKTDSEAAATKSKIAGVINAKQAINKFE